MLRNGIPIHRRQKAAPVIAAPALVPSRWSDHARQIRRFGSQPVQCPRTEADDQLREPEFIMIGRSVVTAGLMVRIRHRSSATLAVRRTSLNPTALAVLFELEFGAERARIRLMTGR